MLYTFYYTNMISGTQMIDSDFTEYTEIESWETTAVEQVFNMLNSIGANNEQAKLSSCQIE